MSDDGSGLGDLSRELEEAKQANTGDGGSEQSAVEQQDSAEASNGTPETDTDDELTDSREEPAFPYDETVQFPHYAREEARDEFEAACKYDAERTLEQDHGLQNVEKREMHDAALRLVADHPDLWARYVMEARGLDPDDLGEGDE
jgi:hypothetical protein